MDDWQGTLKYLDPDNTGQITYRDFVNVMDPPNSQSVLPSDTQDKNITGKKLSPEKNKNKSTITREDITTAQLSNEDKRRRKLQSAVSRKLPVTDASNLRKLFLKVPHSIGKVVSTSDLCRQLSSMGILTSEVIALKISYYTLLIHTYIKTDVNDFAVLTDPKERGIVTFRSFLQAVQGFKENKPIHNSERTYDWHRMRALKEAIGLSITANNSLTVSFNKSLN